jgi:hypothetical protein
VVPGTKEVFREDWENAGRDAPHVDYATDDLAGFSSGKLPQRSLIPSGPGNRFTER